jgi:hypothetical protein
MESVAEPLGDEEDEVFFGNLGDADGARFTAAMSWVDKEPLERDEGAARDLGSGTAERGCRCGSSRWSNRGDRQEERCEGCDGVSGS